MVKIRLSRVGAKKQASYRIVVADSRAPRKGRIIELIGSFNPRTEPETVKIQEDRALYWLNTGAQPTDAVARLLKNNGTLARLERLQKGESLEALVAEAEAAAKARPSVSPKTRREKAPSAASKPAAEPAQEAAQAAPEATQTEPAATADEGGEAG